MLRVATVPEALAAYAERPPAAASPEPGPSAAEPAAPAPTIVGTPGFDFLLGTFGNNHLQGLAGTDFLLGGFGDDVLDGGSEADLMWDFAGNDTYIVDNVGDLVFDWFGHDTARSTISYALGWTLEDLELTGTADVNGTGNYRDNMLRGNSAANFLDGRQGADTLAGGRGDDSLRGGEGSDTYLLARGDGRDIITEDDMPEIGVHEIDVDVVAFGPAISADQLWFRRIGSDLEVSIVGTTDMFTVRDWYVDSRHQVEQFRTSDGKLLQHTQVESLVQAMAGFDVPAGAQTAWLANDQNSLSGVIAANWN
jgi:Ca2+-binding RTX toxin-like protein